MYIHNSYNFMFAHRQMTTHNNAMSKALQRLSSGYRINSAADDPAGLAISERMRAQITSLNQAVRNAQSGANMVDTADGALAEVQRMLNRMVAITNTASSSTLSETQRTALQSELDQLLEEMERTANATHFGGIHLLNGSSSEEVRNSSEIVLQVGPTQNPYDKIAVQMPGLNAALKMLDGISVMSVEAANAAMERVSGAIDSVSAMRGSLGAQANRLEHTVNSLEVMAENLTEAESRIRDADMAKEMMNFVKAQVGSMGAQIAMTHAMQEPYRVIELLKTMGGGDGG
ncbi:MAG: flagellin [Oscillospiraceae bacterium]